MLGSVVPSLAKIGPVRDSGEEIEIERKVRDTADDNAANLLTWAFS